MTKPGGLIQLLMVFVVLLGAAVGPGPAAAQMAHQVNIGTPGDDTQISLGTLGRDFILQDGLGGNDTQYATGNDADDWLEQNGGDGDDTMNIIAGAGNDFIHQDGGSGNNSMTIGSGGTEND